MTERRTTTSDERLPVLIPSYNGAKYVNQTLKALPAHSFEPLVVVNGADDGTLEQAERFGVKAIESPEKGKMPAIQEGLKYLGNRALHPLAIMDVDTQLVFPSAWHKRALSIVGQFPDTPLYMTAPVIFTDRNPVDSIGRTAWYYKKGLAHPLVHDASDGPAPISAHYGPNTLVHFPNEPVLEAILNMPNYWPGEDRAMADVVLGQGGVLYGSHSLDMVAVTPLSEAYERVPKALTRKALKLLGISQHKQSVEENYIQRGPVGSIPYPHPQNSIELEA